MISHPTHEDDDAIIRLMEKINMKLAKFTDHDPKIPTKVFTNTQAHPFSSSNSLPNLLHSNEATSLLPHQILY